MRFLLLFYFINTSKMLNFVAEFEKSNNIENYLITS